ncbi:hypothetical protein [Nocardiopsis halophila]|uniref:hypothetical protein n=1 Tax=Nocardiopsis halophila TaxID=141692 RepID=UPI00034D4449|nr:hypothetical protein [Nocardiopsis halophila]
MPSVPSPVITTAGLVGGYTAARATGVRPLGGVVLAACGAAAYASWRRGAGPRRAAALTGVYLGAFGLSHPLAKKIGSWPSVLAVTAGTAAAAWAFGERSGGSDSSGGELIPG